MFFSKKKDDLCKAVIAAIGVLRRKKEVLGRKHLLASIKAKFYSKVIKGKNQMNNFAIGKRIQLQQIYKCITIEGRKSDEKRIKNKFII